jgi:TRAP-type C4-dicarboxylate transport system substrate-binding protein
MPMRRLWIALALIVLIFGLGPAPSATAGTTIKIATVAPEGSTWMNLMDELKETVKQKTDGRVKLRFYPGGIQGDENVVLRKMMTGQLHGAGLTGVGLGELAPELRVLELPLIFNTQEEVRTVHEKLDPEFEGILGKKGFSLLGWAEVGFIYLFSKKPVRNDEDLRRLKVWLWEGDPLAEAFLDELNVSPVPLSITDVMTGLQTGLVEAVYVSPLGAIALQWFTRVSYMTKIPVTHALGAVVVKTEQLNKLSPEDREILMSSSREVFRKLAVATEEENARAEEVLQERGITFVDPDPAIREEFETKGRRVWQRLAGELYGQELLDRVINTVKDARTDASG